MNLSGEDLVARAKRLVARMALTGRCGEEFPRPPATPPALARSLGRPRADFHAGLERIGVVVHAIALACNSRRAALLAPRVQLGASTSMCRALARAKRFKPDELVAYHHRLVQAVL